MRRAQRHGRGVDVADENVARGQCHASQRCGPCQFADDVEHDVDTSATGYPARLGGEVELRADDHIVGALLDEKSMFGLGSGDGDDARPEHARYLHGMDTDPATCSGDQHRLAGLNPRHGVQAMKRRSQRAGNDRRLLEADAIGNPQQAPRGHRHVLRIATRQSLAEQAGAVLAKVVPGTNAHGTVAAMVLHQDHDPILDLDAGDTLAKFGHLTRHLMAHDARQDGAREMALPGQDVVIADAAGPQPDQHLPGARRWRGQFFTGELFRPAEALQDDRLHIHEMSSWLPPVDARRPPLMLF